MEGADLVIISSAGALQFGNIAGQGGGRSGQTGENIFTMDPPFDRSIVFGRM